MLATAPLSVFGDGARPAEDTHLTEQKHADARTFSLADFRTQSLSNASTSDHRTEPLAGRAEKLRRERRA